MISTMDRYVGALLGLAVGDALGTTLEFTAPGSFRPIDDMVGGGPFRLRPGQWTDDTSMALCLAESLVESGGFDPADQMRRYVRWKEQGHWSCTGECFDIGNITRHALVRFKETGEPYSGLTSPDTAGNGSLMRLSPVPMALAADAERAIALAGDSSRTTHGTRAAVDACRYFAALLIGALSGRPKQEILSPMWTPVPGLWERQPLHPDIAAIATGSFHKKSPPDIRGGRGWVVDTLEAALWAFASNDDFERGALAAVNLGGDADTTGAVFGQIAGAFYGASSIPSGWREIVAMREEITAVAGRLYEVANREGRGLGAGA